MSDKRASELPAVSTVGPNDQLYVVSSGFSGITTAAAIKMFVGSADVPVATTTVAGKVILASSGDVSSIDRAVTPAILSSGLSTKAATNHTHSGYALDGHGHAIADVTGLQTALDGKAASVHTHSGYAASTHSHVIADVTGLQAALDLKATLASPSLTGTPTAPTATAGTSTTQLATTAFVQAAVPAPSAVNLVSTSRALTAADDGDVLEITADGVVLTVPEALPAQFGCAVMVTTGTTSVAVAGSVTLNGAAATLTRASTTNPMFAIVRRTSTAFGYTVTGS